MHLSDFPRGWQREKKVTEITRLNCGPSYADLTVTGHVKARGIDSPSRFRGKIATGSEVAIFESEAQARAAFALFTSKQAYDCFAKDLAQNYKTRGLRVGPANVPNGLVESRRLGDRSQSYEFWFSLYRQQRTDTADGVVYELTTIQSGRAVARLTTMFYHPGLIPRDVTTGLPSKIAERMAPGKAPASAG